MQRIKTAVFYLVLAAVPLAALELGAHLVLKYSALGTRSEESFSIRSFTVAVGDRRAVTMRPGLDITVKEGGKPWSLKTGSAATRIPPEGMRQQTNRKVFLFLGDSVPFGWGVDGDQSLPNIFSRRNPEYQVVNAAIPSYSLAQAVARFSVEFRSLKPSLAYLQIYDPASQYAQYGANWDEEDNWTNYPQKASRLCRLWPARLSAHLDFFRLTDSLYYRIACTTENRANTIFRDFTAASDARFGAHIRSQIAELVHALPEGSKLVVAPITPPPESVRNELNARYRHAIEAANSELQQSALDLGQTFLDTRAVVTDGNDFIDKCCHLSPQGAEKVAASLESVVGKKAK
jgi:hypothetical protein